jgi:hypothetical protein
MLIGIFFKERILKIMYQRALFIFLTLIVCNLPFSILHAQIPLNKQQPIDLGTHDDSKPKNFIILAGTSGKKPMVIVSRDSGKSWKVKKTDNLPNNIDFSQLSCAGKGTKITCINPSEHAVIVTNDAGENWDVRQLSTDAYEGPEFTRCTGEGEGIICIAGPLRRDNLTYMAASQDAGKKWHITRPTNYPDDPPTDPQDRHAAGLGTASCGGSGDKAMCVLGGSNYYYTHDDEHERTYPLAVFSKDGGKSWNTTSPSDGMNSFAISSGCTSNNKNVSCVLGGYGQDYNYYYALLMSSGDDFKSGGGPSSPDDPFMTPTISTISCSSSQNPLCFLGGKNIFIFNNENPSFYSDGNYNGSACSGDDRTGFCLFTEEGWDLERLAVGGSVETYPIPGKEIYSIKCAGEDTKAFCAVLKLDNTLLLSFDNAKTWITTNKLPSPINIKSMQIIAE